MAALVLFVLLHDLDTCRQSGLEMNETVPKDMKLDLDYDFEDDDPAWNFFDKLDSQERVLGHLIKARVRLVHRQ